jgi:hypothetical protein
MAITRITISLGPEFDEICAIGKRHKLDKKSFFEFSCTLQAARIWKDWFSQYYGALDYVCIRTNPDDPPDLELSFQKKLLSVEHTSLLTKEYGQLNHLHLTKFQGQGVFLPPLSQKFSDTKELLYAMFTPTPNPPLPIDQMAHAAKLLEEIVVRKLQKYQPSLLVVTDGIALFDWFNIAALYVIHAIRTKTIDLPKDTSILFHAELDPYQLRYASWFIADGGYSIRYRDSSDANFTTLEEFAAVPFYEWRKWHAPP